MANPASSPEPAGSYQVIARRYRPRFFSEVVGQEPTADTLRQALLQNRLAHAYLFCGPRGVGKTSMARIFARALQCPQAKDGDPCDACATCDRIFRGEDLDVVEMDGASHRGIDDIRDLIQHVRYASATGRYRIFIIDEVHMLTREAFNALLKTLEEPPDHVKFVFATTEVEKVPPTVLSRCQRCDFSAITPADIVRRLAQIAETEGATPEAGLLERIADLSRGGMRDSQSLLDQLLSFAGLSPTLADLDRITGRMPPAAVAALVDRLDSGDRRGLVQELMAIERGGTDPAVLLEQVVEEYRGRLHRGVEADGGGAGGAWGNSEIEHNLLAQEILQEARLRARQLSRADIVLELALLRISTLTDLVPLSGWVDDSAETRLAAPPAASPAASGGNLTPRVETPPPRGEPTAPFGPREVKACLERISNTVANMVGDRMIVGEGGQEVRLKIDAATAKLLDRKKIEACEKELSRIRGHTVRVCIDIVGGSEGNEPSTSGGPADGAGAPPDIVEKAKQIFHGDILGKRRPS